MRALIHIAQNGQKAPVTARTLTRAEYIAIDFAYKTLRQLTQAGFLKRRTGPHGGFTLSQKPRQITLLDVLEAIQGPLAVRKCLLDYSTCPRRLSCTVSSKLEEFQNTSVKLLKNITLTEVTESKPQPHHRKQTKARIQGGNNL